MQTDVPICHNQLRSCVSLHKQLCIVAVSNRSRQQNDLLATVLPAQVTTTRPWWLVSLVCWPFVRLDVAGTGTVAQHCKGARTEYQSAERDLVSYPCKMRPTMKR